MLEEDCAGKKVPAKSGLPACVFTKSGRCLRTVRWPGNHWSSRGWRAEELKWHLNAKACSLTCTGLSSAAPRCLPKPTDKKRQGLEEVLPPGFSDFMPRPQTLTLFFWQGSHLLHEDQGESVQSRGCGRLLTDRAHLLVAMLLLVLLRLRVSSSPLHSTTQELHHVKPLRCDDRSIWSITVKNYTPRRTNGSLDLTKSSMWPLGFSTYFILALILYENWRTLQCPRVDPVLYTGVSLQSTQEG